MKAGDQLRRFATSEQLVEIIEHQYDDSSFVTVARESGSGASTIVKLVAQRLDHDRPGDPPFPWTVFDRNLVTMILKDHDLSRRIEEYMPEDSRFRISEAFVVINTERIGFEGVADVICEALQDLLAKARAEQRPFRSVEVVSRSQTADKASGIGKPLHAVSKSTA